MSGAIVVLDARAGWLPCTCVCLQHELSAMDIFQTWNPVLRPREETILGESLVDRPIVSLQSVSVGLDGLTRVQGQGHLHFCGSYARYGVCVCVCASTMLLYYMYILCRNAAVGERRIDCLRRC